MTRTFPSTRRSTSLPDPPVPSPETCYPHPPVSLRPRCRPRLPAITLSRGFRAFERRPHSLDGTSGGCRATARRVQLPSKRTSETDPLNASALPAHSVPPGVVCPTPRPTSAIASTMVRALTRSLRGYEALKAKYDQRVHLHFGRKAESGLPSAGPTSGVTS